MRLDVLLNRLCLTRSRTEAKQACEDGAILLAGAAVKPSQEAGVGDRVTLRFAHRLLEVEILEVPGKSVSKKAAREMYVVHRDERVEFL